MEWLDDFVDLEELRQCARDLIALLALPATWTGLTPAEICDSAAAGLLTMLDADLVFIRLPATPGIGAVDAAQTRLGSAGSLTPGLSRLLAPWLGTGPAPVGRDIDNPFGGGTIKITHAPIGPGAAAVVVAGSARTAFPSVSQQLLLAVGSDEIALALRNWPQRGAQRSHESLVEHSPDFVGIIDFDGKVQYINPAGRLLIGLGDTHAFGGSIMELVAEADREGIAGLSWPQVHLEGRSTGDVALINQTTGEIIPLAMEWFVVDDPRTGRPTSMAAVSRDLRPHRRLERDLRAANVSLEGRLEDGVAEVTRLNDQLQAETIERERTNSRLRDLQLQLFHASRLSAAGQMATAIAHELSQPLAASTLSLNLLRRLLRHGGEDQDDAAAVVDEALEQISRAGEIIARMRDFIRHGRTRRQLEDIGSILKDAVAFAMTGPESLDTLVSLNLPKDLEQVYVDRVQIQQVVVNLLRNAIEAGTPGVGREIWISAVARDGVTEIAVADNGPGLPVDIRDRLFEPFLTTKVNGMGLGLAIAQSIVEAHGGTMTADRNPEPGAVFRFTLERPPTSEE